MLSLADDVTFETDATELLRTLTGDPQACFRSDQLQAIRSLVIDRRRALVVQRTGWGKSAVYFIATKLLRDRGAGPTILLSPLLALMRNQIEAAERMGLRAATINSANTDDWDEIHAALDRGEVDLLLISPERLANPGFRRDVLPFAAAACGLLVIDEAHCISDWGHDFRPDYRRVVRVLDLLPPGLPVLCCTATANDRVVADIQAQLGTDLTTSRGPLAREGLALHVIDLPSAAERLAWLTRFVDDTAGSGIVYCLTIDDTERVASWLRRQGVAAAAYSGRTDPTQREPLEQALLTNELKVLVATSALGMGFDKPDLAFVVHYQSPGSPIAYYQQVGRAGRRLADSVGVLLRGTEDEDIQDWFIKTAFPPPEVAERVIQLLSDRLDDGGGATSSAAIESQVNVSHSRLEIMLKVLEVDGAVEKVSGGWLRTPEPWTYDHERVDAVTATRRAEQAAMREFATTPACRMELLRRQLDDPEAGPCGRCDRCTGRDLRYELDPQVVAAALDHLRQGSLTIEPRKRWPAGVPSLSGSIGADIRVREGRALCHWGDGGWGRLVQRGKQQDGAFAPELVDAAARLIEQWHPDPPPTWVTFVPSARQPGLVAGLAEQIAERLGLPCVPAVRLTRTPAPQATMNNSAQQAANVAGAFTIDAVAPAEPVLLIDDLADSRWTLTLVGAALRKRAGVPAVHPFTLASGPGD